MQSMIRNTKNCLGSCVHHSFVVSLFESLDSRCYILEPSLSISSHETQVVDGVTVHKLECQTSTGELLNLAMSEEKYQIFKSGTYIFYLSLFS
jgi:hypothetical protein